MAKLAKKRNAGKAPGPRRSDGEIGRVVITRGRTLPPPAMRAWSEEPLEDWTDDAGDDGWLTERKGVDVERDDH